MSRKILIVSGGALLAMVAIWYVALFSPQGSSLSAANVRLDAARQRQTELRAQLRSLQAAKSASASVQAQIKALKQAIPDTAELANFVDSTNSAATASGVDFISISPTPPAAAKGATVQELRLSLAVKGTYFQVIDFVNRLDAMPRMVMVDGLNLAADKGGVLSAQLNARLFVQSKPYTAAPSSANSSSANSSAGSK